MMHFMILKINAICQRDAQFNDFAYKKSMEYIDTINPITAQVSNTEEFRTSSTAVPLKAQSTQNHFIAL